MPSRSAVKEAARVIEPSNDIKRSYSGIPYYGGANARVKLGADRLQYDKTKRGMDILLASTGLFVLFPLLFIVAILIKWDDPKGGFFFFQERVGKDGRLFRMVKFRTMIVDAENMLQDLLVRNEIKGNMFKMKNDPRVTRIGRLLRKTSVDELPQLWNVLRGEMSLVGPRPCLPREAKNYSSIDKLRLAVTPGCTGLWQVSGRNALSFEQMVELDLHYIRHRSLGMDMKLMLRTVKIMVLPNDAY
ncbi:sugar transferase [Cohnella sp. GCM10020058]|uniref:sugar transferase n=1 Tax=Cohnella sp. GCM10020058 TaxID=3317330 RepID=UPI00362CF813